MALCDFFSYLIKFLTACYSRIERYADVVTLQMAVLYASLQSYVRSCGYNPAVFFRVPGCGGMHSLYINQVVATPGVPFVK